MVSQCGLVKGEGQSIIIFSNKKITEKLPKIAACYFLLVILYKLLFWKIVTFLHFMLTDTKEKCDYFPK